MTGEEYAAIKRRERRREYYRKNREKILSRNREYYRKNREKIRIYHTAYMREYRLRNHKKPEEKD